MTSKNIFFTLCFWVELPQVLGLGFSVQSAPSGRLCSNEIRGEQYFLSLSDPSAADGWGETKDLADPLPSARPLGGGGRGDGGGRLRDLLCAHLPSLWGAAGATGAGGLRSGLGPLARALDLRKRSQPHLGRNSLHSKTTPNSTRATRSTALSILQHTHTFQLSINQPCTPLQYIYIYCTERERLFRPEKH